ncbi:unnamed protein product [Sympodiomycopsis kandeliae]
MAFVSSPLVVAMFILDIFTDWSATVSTACRLTSVRKQSLRSTPSAAELEQLRATAPSPVHHLRSVKSRKRFLIGLTAWLRTGLAS